MVVDEAGTIVRLDPAGKHLAAHAGFDWSLGDTCRARDMERVAAWMADALIAALRGSAMPPAVADLFLTDRLGEVGDIGGVMFSGGVAEFVYGRETRDFGDLGRLFGDALRQKLDAGALPWPLLPAGECIRATALGASEYSVQLSGNTIHVSDPKALLPQRNLQVLQPDFDCSGEIDPERSPSAIRKHFQAFDLVEGEGEVALAFRWQGAPSYARLFAFATGIAAGLKKTIAAKQVRSTSCSTATSPDARPPARRGARREKPAARHRRHRALGFRLHRHRPHPAAVVHGAGDGEVAGLQRRSARRPGAAEQPACRAKPRAPSSYAPSCAVILGRRPAARSADVVLCESQEDGIAGRAQN